MGVKDSEGYLKIIGRLTDMIIVGGFNTYPAEIENFFLRHPKVLDVSIVGYPIRSWAKRSWPSSFPKRERA
jgi:fatty-acyl-CoA synthase